MSLEMRRLRRMGLRVISVSFGEDAPDHVKDSRHVSKRGVVEPYGVSGDGGPRGRTDQLSLLSDRSRMRLMMVASL